MTRSYNKLWKLLIDKKMNKTQLREAAKISSNAMAHLSKEEVADEMLGILSLRDKLVERKILNR